MTTTFSFGTVPGLTGEEQRQLAEAYNYHQSRNATKDKYYEGHVTLQDVNLGIALPKGLSKLEVGCNWGQKAVDALASRSMFDGFVSNGGALDGLQKLVADNRLVAAYAKACRDQLKYGCVFATLSADTDIGCRIRFHPPATASALWNGEKGRIDCGLAIIDTVQDEHQKDSWRPALVNFYTDTAVIVLRSSGSSWAAERVPHRMGRPLMEPLIWNATSNKPFGRSRLKRAIRSLIDDYVRTVANATLALEFDTTPQKYILGVTDEQYDAIMSDKFKTYMGSIIPATSNPETGENPVFGQLAQGSLQPHVEKMRMTATQFAAATGLTVTDVGVVNDANPTSSDAILAQGAEHLIGQRQQQGCGACHGARRDGRFVVSIDVCFHVQLPFCSSSERCFKISTALASTFGIGTPISPAFSMMLKVSFAINPITTASRTKLEPITASSLHATSTIIRLMPLRHRPFQPALLSSVPVLVFGEAWNTPATISPVM